MNNHFDLPRILFIEACNFVNAPQGGQLTAARMLIRALGARMALVGWTDDPEAPIGRWHKRIIDGMEYDFLATVYVPSARHKRPLIPARAKCWFQFKWHGRAILSCGITNILTREPTVMMALPFTPAHNVCFWFPGIEPALSISRYGWAKRFAPLFDTILNLRLRRTAGTILAAADSEAIVELRQRARGVLDKCVIRTFPTRVDTECFHQGVQSVVRQSLSLPLTEKILVTSGRLHRAKGWPLLLDAFELFLSRHGNSRLVFVGDGADRPALEQAVAKKRLSERVFLAGHKPPEQLSLYLQAADLFVMGSEKEGWSTSLVEALACGLPIVTTRFSSADSIVLNGRNGFVVERNPVIFARAMEDALNLSGVGEFSHREVDKYALVNLAASLEEAWQVQ
jgi:glycosyltransferase involved in cell wall biosynthesis